jgi:hypothetical protein
MAERTLRDLVDDLLTRRRGTSDPPPILLLGAGASVDAGIGAMPELYKQFRVRDFAEFERRIGELNDRERYRQLHEFLQTREPAIVTPGYRALALLCANYFFDVVFTTNLDPLLDDALASVNMRRRDYLLLVNGIIRPDRLRTLLLAPQPRVKVLKLHGDLFHRFMAWTNPEMRSFLDEIEASLFEFVRNRDVLVVGHSLRDDSIRKLAFASEGAVWQVALGAVHEEAAASPKVRLVRDPSLTFENLFVTLASRLELPVEALEPAPNAVGDSLAPDVGLPGAGGRDAVLTMDDFVASIVGIAKTPHDEPLMTGFLLREPRVIVTDGAMARMAGLTTATVVTRSGTRFPVRQLGTVPGHTFGPCLFEAPPAFTAAGLDSATGPVEIGAPVHVGVAAGKGVGLSSGRVNAVDASAEVAPVGMARDLVKLELAVAPGSAGAPVVNAAFELQGFIVAGRADELPESYMFPVARWISEATAIGGGTVAVRSDRDMASVHDALLQGLYDVRGNGFEKALEAADEYLRSHRSPDDYVFWLRYAAAQGQRAKVSLDKGDSAAYFEARKGALDAARKVVALSPTSGKEWLSSLWDPNDRGRLEGEDDLYVFKSDEEFKQLLRS